MTNRVFLMVRSAIVLGFLAMFTTPVLAQEYTQSIVVVIDDSGFVDVGVQQPEEGQLVPYTVAKRSMRNYLKKNFPRSTYVTLISVARPRIVWQGSLKQFSSKNNSVVASFINGPSQGCAYHEQVIKQILRAERSLPAPLTDVVYLSSLVQAQPTPNGAEACNFDRSNLTPPQEFFRDLRLLLTRLGAKATFFWTNTHVQDPFDEEFYDNDVQYHAYSIEQTMSLLR